jgi:hypothetical protein
MSRAPQPPRALHPSSQEPDASSPTETYLCAVLGILAIRALENPCGKLVPLGVGEDLLGVVAVGGNGATFLELLEQRVDHVVGRVAEISTAACLSRTALILVRPLRSGARLLAALCADPRIVVHGGASAGYFWYCSDELRSLGSGLSTASRHVKRHVSSRRRCLPIGGGASSYQVHRIRWRKCLYVSRKYRYIYIMILYICTYVHTLDVRV